jgi:hypothetical protein
MQWYKLDFGEDTRSRLTALLPFLQVRPAVDQRTCGPQRIHRSSAPCNIWYAAHPEVQRFVHARVQGRQRTELQAMLQSGRRIKVTYKPYDWGTND